MNYETGKKLAVFGFIGRLLVFFIGTGLNIVLPMTYGVKSLEEYNNIQRIVGTFNGVGYTLVFGLAVLGFFFMFMEERESVLLITAASLGVAALPNFLGLFGVDISAQGLINNLGLDGVLVFVLFFGLSLVYSFYFVMFSVHCFKNGNPIFGIISAVFFLWHTVGNIVLIIIQSHIYTYGTMAVSQYATILNLIVAAVFIVESVFLIIHTAKSY
ncbi:MAG: hypothetical protein E7564_00970 [Ruminococcaceae bacterium]|nr:hypothetical protein [Oscillospiraceae bacterium]